MLKKILIFIIFPIITAHDGDDWKSPYNAYNNRLSTFALVSLQYSNISDVFAPLDFYA